MLSTPASPQLHPFATTSPICTLTTPGAAAFAPFRASPANLHPAAPGPRGDFFVDLLIWKVIPRPRNLPRLDRDASEALWAIVIRRNAPDPDGPRDPNDHVSLKPME